MKPHFAARHVLCPKQGTLTCHAWRVGMVARLANPDELITLIGLKDLASILLRMDFQGSDRQIEGTLPLLQVITRVCDMIVTCVQAFQSQRAHQSCMFSCWRVLCSVPKIVPRFPDVDTYPSDWLVWRISVRHLDRFDPGSVCFLQVEDSSSRLERRSPFMSHQ